MKKFILLTVLFALLLPGLAYSQFETVWFKKLESQVNAVAFSHNSKYVMAHLSPNIKIFDVETGEMVNDKIPATVQNPCFSLDDTHIYGIENNRIAYYNLETGIDESTALPFTKNITLFSVSNDQNYLLGATKDSADVGFGVWNLKTGELLKYKKLYTEYNRMGIDSTDFVASCEQIVLDCANNTLIVKEYTRSRKLLYIHPKDGAKYDIKYNTSVKLFDYITLDSIRCMYNEPVSVYLGYFVLSNNCNIIAFRLQDEDNGVITYDVNTMQEISKLNIDGNTKMTVKFTSDDKYIVTASDAGADLWEVSTGKLIKKVEGGTLYTLDISKNDKYGASTIGEYLYLYRLTGISDVPNEPDEIEVLFPNPTDGSVTLNFTLPQSSELTAKITNSDGGSPVSLFSGFLPEGANTLQFSLAAYTQGTYFITLVAAGYNKIFKIIIVK